MLSTCVYDNCGRNIHRRIRHAILFALTILLSGLIPPSAAGNLSSAETVIFEPLLLNDEVIQLASAEATNRFEEWEKNGYDPTIAEYEAVVTPLLRYAFQIDLLHRLYAHNVLMLPPGVGVRIPVPPGYVSVLTSDAAWKISPLEILARVDAESSVEIVGLPWWKPTQLAVMEETATLSPPIIREVSNENGIAVIEIINPASNLRPYVWELPTWEDGESDNTTASLVLAFAFEESAHERNERRVVSDAGRPFFVANRRVSQWRQIWEYVDKIGPRPGQGKYIFLARSSERFKALGGAAVTAIARPLDKARNFLGNTGAGLFQATLDCAKPLQRVASGARGMLKILGHVGDISNGLGLVGVDMLGTGEGSNCDAILSNADLVGLGVGFIAPGVGSAAGYTVGSAVNCLHAVSKGAQRILNSEGREGICDLFRRPDRSAPMRKTTAEMDRENSEMLRQLGPASVSTERSSVAGRWAGTGHGNSPNMKIVLELQSEGNRLSGSFEYTGVRGGLCRQSIAGQYNPNSGEIRLRSTGFLVNNPGQNSWFCLIDDFTLQLQNASGRPQSMVGSYWSSACNDKATLTVTRVGQPPMESVATSRDQIDTEHTIANLPVDTSTSDSRENSIFPLPESETAATVATPATIGTPEAPDHPQPLRPTGSQPTGPQAAAPRIPGTSIDEGGGTHDDSPIENEIPSHEEPSFSAPAMHFPPVASLPISNIYGPEPIAHVVILKADLNSDGFADTASVAFDSPGSLRGSEVLFPSVTVQFGGDRNTIRLILDEWDQASDFVREILAMEEEEEEFSFAEPAEPELNLESLRTSDGQNALVLVGTYHLAKSIVISVTVITLENGKLVIGPSSFSGGNWPRIARTTDGSADRLFLYTRNKKASEADEDLTGTWHEYIVSGNRLVQKGR